MKLPKKVSQALKEFVKACKRKFGKNLVSIVLFDSRVKGYAREDSDYDILVIAKGLPEYKKRFTLVEDIENKIWDNYSIKISSILVEPEEIFNTINPLLFGVLTGYKVLAGKSAWKNSLKSLTRILGKTNFVYVEGGKEWRVKELLKI